MPSRPNTKPKRTYRPRLFRDRDLRRAIASAQKMGLPVSGYTVGPDGRISIVIGAPGSGQTTTDQTNNPWDAVLKKEDAS
jgi:hypothetical protein